MKITPLLFFIFCAKLCFGQTSDTSANKKSGKKNNLFMKLNTRNAYAMIKPGVEQFNFKSMFGAGVEMIVGFKLYERTAFGFGLQGTQYFLNQSNINRALSEFYTEPWMSAEVIPIKKSSLLQKAFFVYVSGWKQNKRNIFEYYARLSMASFQYKLNSNVFRKSSNDSIMVSYDNGFANTSFITGAGVNYSRQFSKIFYVGAGLEYNYNITPRTYIYTHDSYYSGQEGTYTMEVAAPAHFLIFNIGLMYKPYKPCHCKDQKPW